MSEAQYICSGDQVQNNRETQKPFSHYGLGIDYYTTSTPTNYVSFSGSIALESSGAFYLEVYKIGKLVHFVMQVKIANSNDGAWKVKINKYPIKNIK